MSRIQVTTNIELRYDEEVLWYTRHEGTPKINGAPEEGLVHSFGTNLNREWDSYNGWRCKDFHSELTPDNLFYQINFLANLAAEIPEDRALERIGFEERIKRLKAKLDERPKTPQEKMRVALEAARDAFDVMDLKGRDPEWRDKQRAAINEALGETP